MQDAQNVIIDLKKKSIHSFSLDQEHVRSRLLPEEYRAAGKEKRLLLLLLAKMHRGQKLDVDHFRGQVQEGFQLADSAIAHTRESARLLQQWRLSAVVLLCKSLRLNQLMGPI